MEQNPENQINQNVGSQTANGTQNEVQTGEQGAQPVDIGGIKDLPVTSKLGLMLGTSDPKRKKYFKIALSLLVVIILLYFISILANIIRNRRPSKPAPTPTPVASNTPAPTSAPSRYASDSGVLKIDQDVRDLDKDLNNINFHDQDLRMPDVYFDKLFGN